MKFSDVGNNGQILVGTASRTDDATGWAYKPSTEPIAGDLWLKNADSRNNNPTSGTYGFQTIVHELGHALGLKHPFDESAQLSGDENSFKFTNMAYDYHPNMQNVEPLTPLLYDIAAIQYLYGANTNTRTGNDTYSWGTNQTFIQAIWDAGGNDTISAANQTRRTIIDLRAGQFSSIGSLNNSSNAVDNLAIAFGVTIENAVGGSGNDKITGNDEGNDIRGNAGNDSIYGGNGWDTSMEVLEKTPSTVGMVGTQLIVALMMTLFMVTLEMIVSGAMVAKISSTVVLI